MQFAARLLLVLTLAFAGCNSVSEVNEPPGVGFSYTPKTPSAGTEVTFEARATDPDGQVESFQWGFGDGETVEGATSTHTFEEPGNYEVSVTVTDDRGATDRAQKTVEVQ
ncbi:MAG: hypothetical protein BRD28_05320 [Bacteroidetes bacterium QH_10_64_37]|jgi:PKD repeat protein|nr:MAG: hypothetical protein BRD28_05320 [Bacteroidetes bacterium QH_10_64_37]